MLALLIVGLSKFKNHAIQHKHSAKMGEVTPPKKI